MVICFSEHFSPVCRIVAWSQSCSRRVLQRIAKGFSGHSLISQATTRKISSSSRSYAAAPRKLTHPPTGWHRRPCPSTAAQCPSRSPLQTWSRYRKLSEPPAAPSPSGQPPEPPWTSRQHSIRSGCQRWQFRWCPRPSVCQPGPDSIRMCFLVSISPILFYPVSESQCWRWILTSGLCNEALLLDAFPRFKHQPPRLRISHKSALIWFLLMLDKDDDGGRLLLSFPILVDDASGGW